MNLNQIVDKNSPNRELIMKIFKEGNTKNEFQFFNIDNPDCMNKVYDYYIRYAQNLVDMMSPENNIFNNKNIKELDFSYPWKESLNAGSFEWTKRDTIEINEGSIQKIYAFFYTIVAKGKLLGIKTQEDALLNLNLISHNEGEEEIVVPMFFCGSTERNNIAEYMARFAIEFLIGHEIGHAFNGHTKYYMNVLDKLKVTVGNEERERLFLELQTLEMDADAYGINRVLEQAVNLIESGDKIVNILNDGEMVFELLCYAIHGLFYILRQEYGYDDIEKYKENMHPPKYVRECMIYGALHEQLTFLNRIYHSNYTFNFRQINLGKLEYDICAALKYENGAYIEFINKNKQKMAEHSKKIEQNWRRVACIIKSESRLPLEGIDFRQF